MWPTRHSGCAQEIDVLEQYAPGATRRTRRRTPSPTRTFAGNRSSGCRKVPYPQPTASTATGDWTGRWSRFAVDWTDEWIAMSVDSTPYALYERSAATPSFTDPLFLALTACVMQRMPPTPTDRFPLEYLIDWVRVYEWVT